MYLLELVLVELVLLSREAEGVEACAGVRFVRFTSKPTSRKEEMRKEVKGVPH